jgi:hypothetical protein
MPGYSNIPEVAILPWIPDDIRIYFGIIMVLFALWFFISLHWWLHIQQHGFPPFYILRLKQVWDRWLAAMKP